MSNVNVKQNIFCRHLFVQDLAHVKLTAYSFIVGTYFSFVTN